MTLNVLQHKIFSTFESLIIGSVRNHSSNSDMSPMNDLISWMKHTFWCSFLMKYARKRFEIFVFEVLMTAQALSSKSLFLCLLHENQLCLVSERQLCRLCTTWQRWHNCKTLHLTQSSILMWHFRCHCDFFKLPITLWQKKLFIDAKQYQLSWIWI